jgi:hypothetical protein
MSDSPKKSLESSKKVIMEISNRILNLNYIVIGLLVFIALLLLWHVTRRKRHSYGCRCRECRYAQLSNMRYAENFEDTE